ncbi:PREDICTED: uncharacterized protein KIAA0825 [Nicrophorus vespilloides]|uniref:Uncharacterized protein KIAA0825 n=1 Tax=Nicrophorus vespilloides TaxID=110193 RepID=A0ABM1M373_NICVS|nr:PREDICTED: uncharacterized protein KIAA0825 [Nicrophorus vespilloides]
MELMEDGNLMDKVLILIQRDMEYYNKKQTVLQEIICPGIVGGRLDFPRSASFAAVKLVLWWEEEFLAAYRRGSGFMQGEVGKTESSLTTTGGCGGIVKASDPSKFITLITKSSDELLGHLHVLTQEALDHADLTVLTGTIGAAALLKNCLWCYAQNTENPKLEDGDKLLKCQKKYQDMGEALAERLLDLHCRLLSLYILQDSDSLDWENQKAFCENERGSYVVQMWWLYMQGTKEDLWNTVPPKMAQRVFSGMLNESLTILTVRYSQARPSEYRTPLHTTDISNLLLCVYKLLPSICNSREELMGMHLNSQSKILRDVHSKCQELLTCLILRGSPLESLYKVFSKGLDKVSIFKPRRSGEPCPWFVFAARGLFPDYSKWDELPEATELILELTVLLSQPQPNWAQLLKVLLMKNCKIYLLLLTCSIAEHSKSSLNLQTDKSGKEKCNGFLCSGDGTCRNVDTTANYLTATHYYDLIYSLSHVVLYCGNLGDFERVLMKAITGQENWFQCFERRQVWNQIRPAWYLSITDLIQPHLSPIIGTVLSAMETGASMYQACSIVLQSFVQIWQCLHPAFTRITQLLQDLLPTSVTPLGDSVLLHLLISALYSELLKMKEEQAMGLGEALCGVDEDNKHTKEIQELLEEATNCMEYEPDTKGCKRVEDNLQILEILVSDILMTDCGKRSLKVIQHFVKNNSDWLLMKLRGGDTDGANLPNVVNRRDQPLLHLMFFIGDTPFDQMMVGEWKVNWLDLFGVPMGLSKDRVFAQITSRWEFLDSQFPSTRRQGYIVPHISSLFKQT